MEIPVLILVIANVATYVVVGISGGQWFDVPGVVLLHWGANLGLLTIGHDWWRLVTSMFLHGGLVHLTVNMISLLFLGRVTHHRFGPGAFFASYFLSGIAGSLASIAFDPARVTVGASGAIFGLAGALFASTFTRNPDLLEANRKFRVELLKVLGFNLVLGATVPGIDNAAHVGGIIGGTLAGAALAAGGNRDRRPTPRRVALVSAVSAIVLVAACGALTRWAAPAPGAYAETKGQVTSALQDMGMTERRTSRERERERGIGGQERLVNEHPDSVPLILDLANSLALAGRVDSASGVLSAAAKRLPDQPELQLAVGALSLNRQQYDVAIEAFETAVRLDPSNQALAHDLGLARLAKSHHQLAGGDATGARLTLEAVLSSGIDPEKRRASQLIDSLERAGARQAPGRR